VGRVRADVRVGAANRWRAGMARAEPMRVWGRVKRQRTVRKDGGGGDWVVGVLSSWGDRVGESVIGVISDVGVIGVVLMSGGGDD